MNWAGVSVVIGLLTLAVVTMPYGLVILVALAYLYRKG